MYELYATFLKTPNFARWLRDKTDQVAATHRLKYLACLADDSVDEWVLSTRPQGQPLGSVEVVDLLLRMREEHTRWMSHFGDTRDDGGVALADPLVPPTRRQWEKLEAQQAALKKFLPPELSSQLLF